MTTVFSRNVGGMCNRFLGHYLLKQFCLARDFRYRCGIDFDVAGFPALPALPAPIPADAIRLYGRQLGAHGGLQKYPFVRDKAYVISGMPGIMHSHRFPGLVKQPLARRFAFEDVKRNMTQFQLRFDNPLLLAEFLPAPHLAGAVDRFIQGLPVGVPVGIHRRRGDYEVWNEGRYLASDAQILEKMALVRSLATQPAQFVLCTDEPESADKLAREPDVHLVDSPREFEWLALQRTRLIIGAVSTFTITAAGFSGLPYLFANEIVTAEVRDRVRAWLAE